MNAQGPREPEAVRVARREYGARARELDALECRVGMTDAGLDFLRRVRAVGRASVPAPSESGRAD